LLGTAWKNIEAFGRLARCRSPHDLISVQSDFALDNIQQAIETSRRIGQVSLRIAEEAAGIVQTEARRNANTDRIRQAA
jgi:Phasin protein